MSAEEQRVIDVLNEVVSNSNTPQAKYAAQIGVSPAAFSMWTNGDRFPKRERWTKIHQVMGVDILAMLRAEQELGMGLKDVRIAIVTSGNYSARTARVESFKTRLAEKLPTVGYKPLWDVFEGAPKATNHLLPTSEQWQQALRANQSFFDNPDYIVTFGTQPSWEFRKFMGARYGEKPTIFLAVTDPAAANLVGTVDQRDDCWQATGVTFGPSTRRVVSFLRELFPGRRLIFVYDPEVPSDKFFAADAQSLLPKGDILSVSPFPTVRDMPDANAVYWSWYTFELMLSHPRASDVTSSRIIHLSGEIPHQTFHGPAGAPLITAAGGWR